jgi:hypothetical protein
MNVHTGFFERKTNSPGTIPVVKNNEDIIKNVHKPSAEHSTKIFNRRNQSVLRKSTGSIYFKYAKHIIYF